MVGQVGEATTDGCPYTDECWQNLSQAVLHQFSGEG